MTLKRITVSKGYRNSLVLTTTRKISCHPSQPIMRRDLAKAEELQNNIGHRAYRIAEAILSCDSYKAVQFTSNSIIVYGKSYVILSRRHAAFLQRLLVRKVFDGARKIHIEEIREEPQIYNGNFKPI